MSGLRWSCALALGLALFVAPAYAQEEIFEQGNSLYQQGEFEAALEAYLRIQESGFVSGPLHYNIANAYFKTGDLPRAILYYERAALELPGDQDVQANLELARSLTIDDIAPLPRFWLLSALDAWIRLLPRGLLIALVTSAYLAVGASLVLLILVRRPLMRSASRWGLILAIPVVVVFGLTLAARELGWNRPDQGIIMTPQISAQSAPTDDPNLTVFDVHAGTKVRIDRLSDGWAEIVLEDGRVGWIRSDAFEAI